MALNTDSAIEYAWIILGVVWILGLLFTKQTVRAQTWGTRLFQTAVAALGFVLLSGNCREWFPYGWLFGRFAPHTAAIADVAVLLTVAGCGFAIWARLTLGRNWSGRVTVKADHELVTRGPYAIARHPIYTGFLIAILGTALAVGQWRGMVALAVILMAFVLKMAQEEKMMMQTFPSAYPEYRRRVKALIPGVF
ncbi:MAG TPA: isoprenylcysteine carboxylmethyltransferase family protein [Terracidiphilus sp.]|nr:isoprenylcysteine carboxylmethyltransferase family protein [Terracidiphilus sp.]